MRYLLSVLVFLCISVSTFAQDKGIVLDLWVENESYYEGFQNLIGEMSPYIHTIRVNNEADYRTTNLLHYNKLFIYNDEYEFGISGKLRYDFSYTNGPDISGTNRLTFDFKVPNLFCYEENEEFIIPKESVARLSNHGNINFMLALFGGVHLNHFDGEIRGRWRRVNVKRVDFPTDQQLTLCPSELPAYLIASQGCTWQHTNNTTASQPGDPANYLYVGAAVNTDYHLECTGLEGCEKLFKVRFSEPSEELTPIDDQVLCPGAELHLSGPSEMRDMRWYRLVPSSDPSCPAYTRECVSYLPQVDIRSQGLYVNEYKSAELECSYYDTFRVVRSPHIAQIVPNQVKICSDDALVSLSLEGPEAYETYLWSDQSSGTSISVQRPGIYWLTATDTLGCVSEGIAEVLLDCGTQDGGQPGGQVREMLFLDKADITTGAELELESFQTPLSSGVDKYTAEVSLQYHRNGRSELTHKDWSYMVIYDITYGSELQRDTLYISNFSDTKIYLSANRYSDASLQSAAYTLEVVSVIQEGTVPEDINLELISEISRYPLLPEGHSITGFGKYHDAGNGRIEYWWAPSPYAYEYELEIAWLDHYLDIKGPLPAEDIFSQFGYNVQTRDNRYTLDATFPKGKLYARVRPVGRFGLETGEIRTGDWSGYVEQEITGFEPDLSWQKVTTFAEEGLKKEVVSYYDGMLRPRQVATGLSSEELSLVAETYYDHEGRGVMQSLPSPEAGMSLKYRPGYNKDASDSPIGKHHVDALSQPAFGQLSGAGQYYSSGNPFLGHPDKYPNIGRISESEGYVSTLVRYRNDNTGKVLRQSGIGALYALDQEEENHYTSYWYGSASPTELHRLFGSNVGQSKYYSKILTTDPNGQASIVYMDMYGRTIATGLTGEAPFNLSALASKQTIALQISLDGNNVKDTDRRLSATYYDILNPPGSAGYTFRYSLGGMISTLGAPFSTCKTCEYDLQIRITDPKGVAVPLAAIYADGSSHAVYENDNTLLTARFDNHAQDCSGGTLYRDSVVFSAVFDKPGNYTVSKELYISSESLDGLLSDIATFPGVESWEDYLEENIVLDTLQCSFTCADFQKQIIRDSLGFFDAENQDHLDLLNALIDSNCSYSNIIAANAGTYAVNECHSYLEQMRFEFSPGGKRFEDSITLLTQVTGNEYFEDTLAQLGIALSSLTTVNIKDTLRGIWTGNLADTLVKYYHPEYCHIAACFAESEYREFTYVMASITTRQEAIAKGYWYDDIETKDPMFAEYSTTYYNYQTFEGGITVSLPDFVKPETVAGQYNAGQQLYRGQDILNNTALRDTLEFNHFRGMLLYIRDSVMAYKREEAGCLYLSDTTDPVVRDPRVSRQSVLADLESEVNDINETSCISSCDIYARNQYRRIVSCMDEDISADSAYITGYLKSVCLDNCDAYSSYTGMPDDEQYAAGILEPVFTRLNGKDTLCSIRETLQPGFTYTYATHPETGDTLYQETCTDGPGTNGTAVQTLVSVYKDLLFAHPYEEADQPVTGAFAGVTSEQTATLADKEIYLQKYTTGQHLYIHRGFIYDSNDSLIYCSGGTTPCFGSLYLMDKTGAVLTHNIRPYQSYKDSSFYDVLTTTGTHANRIRPYYLGYAYVYLNGSYQADTAYIAFLQYNVNGSGCFNDIFPSCQRKKIRTPDIDFNEIFAYEESEDSCKARVRRNAEKIARQRYEVYLDSVRTVVLRAQVDRCMQVSEHFNYSYDLTEYHYTLYYYDKAGNLVQTVPPEGVQPLATSAFDQHGNYLFNEEPEHVLQTNYAYNSRNQVTEQYTPDAGRSTFVYNVKGQLVVSRNAQQQADGKYSFTTYDALSRPVASGQLDSAALHPVTVAAGLKDPDFPLSEQYDPTTTLEQVTFTLYDDKALIPSVSQSNLRHRVSASLYTDALAALPLVSRHNGRGQGLRSDLLALVSGYGAATVYDYDQTGNVRNIYQHLKINRGDWQHAADRKISYAFSLYSGKVNKVTYDPGTDRSFSHVYKYDSDNRIRRVYTQRAGETLYKEAEYFYYPHGPLSRIEIGEDIVQDLDYAYTIQGWLKSINPDVESEPGLNAYIPGDRFMYGLGYHHGDYTPVGGSFPDLLSYTQYSAGSRYGNIGLKYRGLFNGNIAYTLSGIDSLDRTPGIHNHQISEYSYDQLNRLTASKGFTPEWTDAELTGLLPTYHTNQQYDANGNIEQLRRTAWNAANSAYEQMDSLVYHYEKQSGRLRSNRLLHVNDLQTGASLFSEDIDDQGVYTNKETANYRYDRIGNLSKDVSEGIDTIIWNVSGKIREIRFNNGKPDLSFIYDASGQRIAKLIHSTADNAKIEKGDIYWRDAQGNPLSTEQYTTLWQDEEENPVYAPMSKLKGLEYSVYGSSRLGVRNDTLSTTPVADFISTRGWRHYELSNHLGNVQVVVGDYIQGDEHHDPEVPIYSSQDYYAFGMVMPSRSYTFNGNSSLNKYRFGFQGQEKDDEIKGEGNSINYTYRMHDPRTGRFFAVDPLTASYPFYSPYQFSGNRVIDMIELEGLEPTESGSYGGQGAIAPQRDECGDICEGTDNYRWTWNNDTWNSTSAGVTNSELTTIFPNGKANSLKTLEISINLHGSTFGLTSRVSIAHFLSQSGHEVSGFSKGLGVSENLNYSVAGLTGTFGKYFYSGTAVEGKYNADDYGRKEGQVANQAGIANIAYANRMGNGDIASGDGYLYRGRGIFQLTGKDNYTSFNTYAQSNISNSPNFVDKPALLLEDKYSIMSAMWFFQTKVLNKLNINSTTVKDVTLKVNGGDNGLSDRKEIYNNANSVLK